MEGYIYLSLYLIHISVDTTNRYRSMPKSRPLRGRTLTWALMSNAYTVKNPPPKGVVLTLAFDVTYIVNTAYHIVKKEI